MIKIFKEVHTQSLLFHNDLTTYSRVNSVSWNNPARHWALYIRQIGRQNPSKPIITQPVAAVFIAGILLFT